MVCIGEERLGGIATAIRRGNRGFKFPGVCDKRSLERPLYHFCITEGFWDGQLGSSNFFILNGELAGIRTQDPRLKRALLYQLSYELTG